MMSADEPDTHDDPPESGQPSDAGAPRPPRRRRAPRTAAPVLAPPAEGAMPQDAGERADSTARLLDVKYHVLLPSTRDVGGAVDYYQWGALLRSVSAFQAYRRIYRDVIRPKRVAELLILRDDMPRSLRVSFGELTQLLDQLRDMFQRDYLSARLADQMYNRLRFGKIDDVFTQGLHEFLTEVVDSNFALGKAIAEDFGLTY